MPRDKGHPDPEINMKLKRLRAKVKEDSEVAKLLYEYIDAANEGNPIEKQVLLGRSTSRRVRAELEDILQFSDTLLSLGVLYREKKKSVR